MGSFSILMYILTPPPQDGSYQGRADPWYGKYEGQNPGYRDPNYQYREQQTDRPSSRASQYSDRPSSRLVKL